MTRRVRALVGAAVVLVSFEGCGPGTAKPAPLDTRATLCGACRMPVSDRKLAFQLAAPGEEAVFFDDAHCVRTFLSDRRVSDGAVLVVTDHRTGAWVSASEAVFTRVPELETPMGSHVIAHENAASRDADSLAAGGGIVTFAEILGSARLPDGLR